MSADGKMIPYGHQDIDAADIAAVVKALQSDWLTTGPEIARFEDAAARRVQAKHAVAVFNGTVALHLACRALGLGPGDTLWTTPNTFVASANCALYCGASVDFVDMDAKTYNMSVDALEKKLRTSRKKPKVLVPVHFAGQPCDMRAIGALAKKYRVAVIEDASHAVGATYRGEPVGNGRHCDLTVFSFHPVKIITTGEGGMVLASNAKLAAKLRLLRTHGIDREKSKTRGAWYYEQVDLGYNYRLTDVQSALGTSQLQRLDAFLARRRALAARYDRLLADLPVMRPWQHPDGESAWHLYVIQVKQRRKVFETMRAAGIGVAVHYIPVHLHPHYRRLGFKPGDFPAAEAYYERALSLPMYPALTDAQQDQVVAALARAVR